MSKFIEQVEALFVVFYEEVEKHTKDPVLVVLGAVLLFMVTVVTALTVATYHAASVVYAFASTKATWAYAEIKKQFGDPSSDL